MSRKTRKLIWSAPLVAVLAVAAALAIFAAQPPGNAQADHESIPSAPKNLLAKPADGNEGRTAVVLTWLAPERGPVTGYRIDYSTDGAVYMQLEANTGDDTLMYKHDGLDPGKMYIYRVFAINSAGTGLVSETYSTTTTGAAGRPDKVMNLRATVPTTMPAKWHQIDLAWDAPYGGGKKIVNYCIEMTDGDTAFQDAAAGCRALDETTLPSAVDFVSGTAAGLILTGNAMTKHSVKELPAAERRFFKVYAITGAGTAANGYGISEMPSATKNAMTAAVVNPNPPRTLRLAKNDDGTVVNLYWHWPTSDGGVPIDNFRIEVSTSRTDWPLPTEEVGDNPFDGGALTAVATSTDKGVLADVTAATAQSSTAAQQATHTHAVPTTVRKTLYYRVVTKSATKKSVASNIASIIVNGGSNPTTPTFAAVGAAPADGDAGRTTIKLAWTAGTYDHDGDTATDAIDYPASGYRIDKAMGAATGVDLLKWQPLHGHTGFTDTKFDDEGLKPGTQFYYRIFTIGSDQTISTASDLQDATTAPPGALGKARNLMARAVDSTKISVTWEHPKDLKDSDIDHYSVQMKMQGAVDANIDTKTTDGPAKMYEHDELSQNQVWLYRVAAVAPNRTTDVAADEYTGWETATTPAAGKPEMPIGLVAEDARDSNIGDKGVLLIWNKPKGPPGSMVQNYKVERKVMGEDSNYKTLGTSTGMRTALTDFDEPADDEVRMYRVAAVDDGDVTGEWAEVRFPMDTMMKPSAPQNVMAAKSTDMPGSKIKVSWSAPADNADDVTGYIIERKHDDDGVGAIPMDGYNTDAMGAMHAFMNYKEWWETLNCKGMLAVAMAEDNEANQAMYCKHFLDTYPTKIADTDANAGKKISEETAKKVKALFMKRYVTKSDDMGMTKTMFTGMMHYDTGLKGNTEYTYRVRAIHGMKAGAWSAEQSVTTGNNAPMPEGSIAAVTVQAGQMTAAMDVSGYFSDADDNDALTYAATSDDDDIATPDIPAGSSMLTIRGVAEGTATITVTASDGNGGTGEQEIDVTVESGITELTAPTGVTANAVERDGDPGIQDVVVTWTDGMNATQHAVILFDSNWEFDPATDIKGAQTDGTTTFTNVASGAYTVVVVALDDDYEMALDAAAVTVP